MLDRVTAITSASVRRAGCDECLFSPECPACAAGGLAGEHGIGVLVRILHRGDRLFDHGEPFDSVYMVRSGTLKTCTVSASGEEPVIGFHGPGDLAGLDAIHNGRHTSSAIALGTASVCSLPWEPLCRLSARVPLVQSRLLAKMSRYIHDNERRLGLLVMRSAGQRMAAFLIGILDDCRRRGLKCDEIVLPMPRADIASYLALAIETVSRSLTRQHAQRLIEVRRNVIRILDERALRRMAGEVDQPAGLASAGVRGCRR